MRRQVGWWHGRHGTFDSVSIVAASGFSGAQCQGLVGPKMPMVGVPIAAETCWRPESFVTQAAATLSAKIALRRSDDVRSRAAGPAILTISVAKGVSASLPRTQTVRPWSTSL